MQPGGRDAPAAATVAVTAARSFTIVCLRNAASSSAARCITLCQWNAVAHVAPVAVFDAAAFAIFILQQAAHDAAVVLVLKAGAPTAACRVE